MIYLIVAWQLNLETVLSSGANINNYQLRYVLTSTSGVTASHTNWSIIIIIIIIII
jgi:hypothetical protein